MCTFRGFTGCGPHCSAGPGSTTFFSAGETAGLLSLQAALGKPRGLRPSGLSESINLGLFQTE